MSFEEFGLLPELCAAVQQMGWQLPTGVQAECIPLILGFCLFCCNFLFFF
jgi:superfamily II DNA/RNA helicase